MLSKFLVPAVLLLSLPNLGGAQDPNNADSQVARRDLFDKSAAIFGDVERLRTADPEAALRKLSELESVLADRKFASADEQRLGADIQTAIATARKEIGRSWPSPAEIERRLAKNPADVASVEGYARKLSAEVERRRPYNSSTPVEEILAHLYRARESWEHGRQMLAAAQLAAVDPKAKAAIQREERWVKLQLAEIESETSKLIRDGREFPNMPRNIDESITYYLRRDEELGDRLRGALENARLADTRVLIVATDANSQLTRQLIAMLYGIPGKEFTLSPSSFIELMRQHVSYRILWVDCSAGKPADECRALLEKLKVSMPKENEAVFVVVDANGSMVASKDSASLQTGGKLDGLQLAEFLQKHQRDLKDQDAAKLFAAALARATREDKHVLLQTGGPGCAPCILLSRYFEKNQALIGRDYVLCKIDGRMPNAKKVLASLGDHPQSIPWMAILDAAGKPLVTGTGPEGNIGYPNHPAGVMHFETMLRTTAKNLREEEIKTLLEALQLPIR